MTGKLTAITKTRDATVRETLERALNEDLDGVLLVKFKDNGFQVDSSKIISRLEKLGALHQLQHDIMHCDD